MSVKHYPCTCSGGVSDADRAGSWHDKPEPGWTCTVCGGFIARARVLPGGPPAEPDEHLARARELHRIGGEIIEALAPFDQATRFRILKASAVMLDVDVPGLTS